MIKLINKVSIFADDKNDVSKIREYLKEVDKKLYHRAIINRKQNGMVFPHNREDVKLFINTYQYLKLFPTK